MKTVLKAAKILDLFTKDRSALRLSEVASLTGFSKTTTHTLLKTLVSVNYLVRKGRAFSLGAKLFELGNLFAYRLDLRQLGLPHLAELAKLTEDTAHLCVVDDDTALCIATVEGRHAVQVFALITGGRLPLHAGAAPTVLMAGMHQSEIERVVETKGFKRYTSNTIQTMQQLMIMVESIRSEGYSLSWEDITPNVGAVGAPVFDHSGKVIAAISVASIVPRLGPERLPFLIEQVKKAAMLLTAEIGGRPTSPNWTATTPFDRRLKQKVIAHRH